MQATTRVHFSLPIAAGRPAGNEGIVFSWEEIQTGSVERVGPAMVRFAGMGNLRLAFDVPGNAPLASDSDFRTFAQKLIRSIPAPFFSLSLENDSWKLLLLSTVNNLEIQWRVGDSQVSIYADAGEYSAAFTEEASRLRTVLTANGGMNQYEPRMREVTMYCR